MFKPKVYKVKGKITDIGGGVSTSLVRKYDYIDFETADGTVKIGQCGASLNVDKLVYPGSSGLFLFAKYGGRNLAFAATDDGNVEVGAILNRFSALRFSIPAIPFLIGFLLIPIGVGLLLWAWAIYLFLKPGMIRKQMIEIARSEGIDPAKINRRVDF